MLSLKDLLKQAEEAYSNKEYKKAVDLYKKALDINPKRVSTIIDYGNAVDALGDKKLASKLYKDALKIAPENITAMGNLGGTLYELEEYEEALEVCNKVLEKDSEYVMAIVNKANILDVTGKPKEAIELYKEAIKIKPDYAIAYSNLGNVYYEIDRYKDAIKFCQKAVEFDDKDVNAYINMANAYDMLDNHYEAIEAYSRAIDLDENNVTAYNNLGALYEKMQMFDEALNCYWKTIEIDPEYTTGHLNYGYLLYEFESQNKKEKAIKAAKKWVDAFPDNSVAIHMSAAVHAIETPVRASDNYVSELFDSFAPDFDESLKAIEYKAPDLIEEAIKEEFGEGEQKFSVLDAGCGTGLCAKGLKPYAIKGGFVGVDLSSGMLEEAGKRHLYDDLKQAELTDFVNSKEKEYDLIASADVLTYFGDLKEVFKGFTKALKKKGYIVFTVTHCRKVCEKGYDLHASGRYAHTEGYIESLLQENNLELKKIKKCELRKESGYPVWGMLVVAQKND